ncbi:APC family permease [Novosphingobium sp. ZN18A2]|uniref:APC family permease n=1 Tax=Novosphingobium sp. ZN18A2 TaxID=3079861 RepID=UPI0030CD3CAC
MTDREKHGQDSADQSSRELTLGGSWAMGVGGMVGGGIFSTLGVVIAVAGEWAWASFVLGGLIALATGHCMAALTVSSDKAGGIYRFLRDEGFERTARLSAWVLILGYTLTVAVYAATFGSYLGNALGGPAWLPRAMAVAAIVVLAGVNLRGVGQAAGVEIAIVWGKLVILAGLAVLGLAHFSPARLAQDGNFGLFGVVVGAASVFMAYEGFELLAYDYDDMIDRKRQIVRVMPLAIGAALFIYVALALATPMLVSPSMIVSDGEVALAKAGQAALGTFGLLAVTVAAALSTGSAINATLFSTARLAREVAQENELPHVFARRNSKGSPYVGVLVIAALAIAMAVIGGLAALVTGASVVFLLVFGTVDLLAWRQDRAHPWIAGFGTFGAGLAILVLVAHLSGWIA